MTFCSDYMLHMPKLVYKHPKLLYMRYYVRYGSQNAILDLIYNIFFC